VAAYFSGKNIIIFSPQHWSHLYISKHHYARILSRQNKVYFISPPEMNKPQPAAWQRPDPTLPNLHVLRYSINIPERVKFHLPFAYRAIVISKLKRIIRQSIGDADVIIDFGCNMEFHSMRHFPARLKIYFPVDDNEKIDGSTRGSDMVASVSGNILAKFKHSEGSLFFVNHGLAPEFEAIASNAVHTGSYEAPAQLTIAYAGNLFIRFLDIPVFRSIIESNPGVQFVLFGNTSYNHESARDREWYEFLRQAKNVQLKGVLDPASLAKAYEEVDGFLLCYKPDYVNYHAENSHKLLEYLAAGKVLISTHVSLYAGNPLICMSPKDKNEDLPEIFKTVVDDILKFNTPSLIRSRAAYALDNTYEKQLERIEAKLLSIL
jgi:hypothetical protein